MSRWFITGSSRGFGREIALAALRAGHEVVATMRDTGAADVELAKSSEALVLGLDVRDAAGIEAAVDAAVDRFGGIDVLVNNAGRGLLGAIESTTDDEVRELYELNVFSLLAVTRAVLPVMRSADRGHVVNIGSMGGVAAFAGTGVYASTKFAVEGLTEAMRDELAHTNVRVSIVEPGSFRTDFMDGSSMTVARGPRFPEYGPSVDDNASRHLSTNHAQPGDPAKAAAAILRLVESPNPPTHLLLGKDAVARAEGKIASLASELTTWRRTSLSTEHDDLPRLVVTQRGSVAHIEMDSSPVNAFTVRMLQEMRDALVQLPLRIQVVVLSSRVPGIFAAGGDLKYMALADEQTSAHYVALVQEVYRLLERPEHVSLVAIDGACLGGGLEISLAADIRVASPTSKLGLPEGTLGILAGGGAIHRLVRAVGQGVARDLLLAGEPVSGADAHMWGLVSRLADDPVAEAVRIAEKIAHQSPEAMMATKELAFAASTDDFDQGLSNEYMQWLQVRRSSNAQEGLEAFTERREPRFIPRG